MSETLDMLAHYWVETYAVAMTVEECPPTTVVVGAHADAVGSVDPEIGGVSDVGRAAFMAGYLTFPCDAAYIVALLPGKGIEQDKYRDVVEAGSVGRHPSVRDTVVCWAHEVPTRRTLVLMLVKHINDDGNVEWHPATPTSQADTGLFIPLIHAAHDFDGYPIPEAGERELALELVRERSGTGYVATVSKPGTIMQEVEEWAG